jgi:hypothetical protein
MMQAINGLPTVNGRYATRPQNQPVRCCLPSNGRYATRLQNQPGGSDGPGAAGLVSPLPTIRRVSTSCIQRTDPLADTAHRSQTNVVTAPDVERWRPQLRHCHCRSITYRARPPGPFIPVQFTKKAGVASTPAVTNSNCPKTINYFLVVGAGPIGSVSNVFKVETCL